MVVYGQAPPKYVSLGHNCLYMHYTGMCYGLVFPYLQCCVYVGVHIYTLHELIMNESVQFVQGGSIALMELFYSLPTLAFFIIYRVK